MFRSVFSFACLLCAIATVILLHSIEILDGCDLEHALLLLAYFNAAIWMALWLFVCLPFLRYCAKLVRLNALPPFAGLLASALLLYYSQEGTIARCADAERQQSVLFATGSNALLAFLLFVAELSCKGRRGKEYEQIP